MQQPPNPMANVYQAQLEASRRLANAIFTGTERLDRVMIEATHRAFNDQLSFVQAVASGSDIREVGANLQAGMLQNNSDEAVNYQAEIIRIVSEMQSEIGKSVQDCMQQIGSQAISAPAVANQAGETAQEVQGQVTDAMTNPMTSMFSVWESAFREATAMATRNMTTARSNVEQATANAGRYTRQAARAAESASSGMVNASRKAVDGSEDRKGSKSR